MIESLEQSEPKALEGNLAALPLPELLQFLHIGGRGGVLVVHDDSGRPRAVIYYDHADIVHATCDGISGRDAVYAAMAHSSGRFEYFAGRQHEVQSTRYAPPTLVANLLLKQCDGSRSARELMNELNMDEREFLEELKLLVRTHWLDFVRGAEEFARMAAE